MITKAKQNPTPSTIHDGLSIGSAIKQNIVEKLPVINTQVTFKQTKFHKKKERISFFLRQLYLLI
jgi:hypothetical protein